MWFLFNEKTVYSNSTNINICKYVNVNNIDI